MTWNDGWIFNIRRRCKKMTAVGQLNLHLYDIFFIYLCNIPFVYIYIMLD